MDMGGNLLDGYSVDGWMVKFLAKRIKRVEWVEQAVKCKRDRD